MTLLLDAAALAPRRALAAPGAPLAPLADSLARDLDRVLAADVHVADRKARLTRAGGRCPTHGIEFDFDPFTPHRFRCPRCPTPYAGAEHEAFWRYRFQLWLAERALHAAALHAVRGTSAHAAFAARILAEAADVYGRLPNRDNVLGPTRPFFSTYLESLWLLALCVTLDLLERAGADLSSLGGHVRDALVAPSRALIASYPEGRSNRQVWNAAARLAAARLLGDARGAADAAHGPDGVAACLRDGLLPDGSWYEGDNYHQFAHRGLWYGVAMAAHAGFPVDADLAERVARGFEIPFLVAMPGLVVPARRDAQFGASLRQWRWAEWLELGVAADPANAHALAGHLAALYASDAAPARDTGRWRASGEAERNEPAAALTRADLGWKSLLFAAARLPEPPAPHRAPPRSVLLRNQGLAVLRAPPLADTDVGTYLSLDYGPPGGGHRHPDRLNVQLPPFVVDPGTGAYVERTLHWYRSTLAHAAPLAGGRSQPATTGRLLGFDDGPAPEFQAAAAEAEIAAGVVARRQVVLGRGYAVDRLTWQGLAGRPLDLPLGGALADADPPLAWAPAAWPGVGGLEDGFDFLADVHEAPLPGAPLRAQIAPRELADTVDARARVTLGAPAGARLWRARAPGAPGHAATEVTVVRATADAGAITVVWRFTADVGAEITARGDIVVTLADGTTHAHRPGAWDRGGWDVTVTAPDGSARALALALAGDEASEAPAVGHAPRAHRPPRALALPADGAPLAFTLGERHYLRSEVGWRDAGAPSAAVRLATGEGRLRIDVRVRLGRPPTLVPAGTANPLDNERAAINGDGVQLHLGADRDGDVEPVGDWLLVPAPPGPDVDVTRTTPPATAAAAAVTPAARWAAEADGYALAIDLPLPALRAAVGRGALAFDLLVNEKPPGRERRQGQLVLSGLGGAEGAAAFVYLRGDRHDVARGLRLRLPG